MKNTKPMASKVKAWCIVDKITGEPATLFHSYLIYPRKIEADIRLRCSHIWSGYKAVRVLITPIQPRKKAT